MNIHDLFDAPGLKELIDQNIRWFMNGDKEENEIREWVREAYKSVLVKTSDLLPVILLEQLCRHTEKEDSVIKSYMEIAADEISGMTADPMQDATTYAKQIHNDGLSYVEYFVEKCNALGTKTKDEAVAEEAASEEGTSDENAEEKKEDGSSEAFSGGEETNTESGPESAAPAPMESEEEEMGKKSFTKGIAAGLVIGIALAALIIIGIKAMTKAPASLDPVETTEAMTTEASETESEEETTEAAEEIPYTAIINCPSGTVKIRTGPGKNYRSVALANGLAGLQVTCGESFPDENGVDRTWTAISLDYYLTRNSRDLVIIDTGLAELGATYYISSEFLERIEE